jgi:hypothetical protein
MFSALSTWQMHAGPWDRISYREMYPRNTTMPTRGVFVWVCVWGSQSDPRRHFISNSQWLNPRKKYLFRCLRPRLINLTQSTLPQLTWGSRKLPSADQTKSNAPICVRSGFCLLVQLAVVVPATNCLANTAAGVCWYNCWSSDFRAWVVLALWF